MSLASLTTIRFGHVSNRWLAASLQFAQRHRAAWPAAAIVIATIAAYHYTLATLSEFFRLDSPLAYLALLPFFSLGIAILSARRYEGARKPLMDRQHDFLVGVPMLLVALLLITWDPITSSTLYWTHRADVVSLALFAAAATILVYGVNWFWRLRAAFIFLLLSWPTPYVYLMAGVIQPFRTWVDGVLGQLVGHMPFLGVTLNTQATVLFVQGPHAEPIRIAVRSAASGADSILGFGLIGAAILTTMSGGRLRKLRWWVSGMLLTLMLNVVRLTANVVLASHGHPGLASGGYHAIISLLVLAIAVVIMLGRMRFLGLHRRGPMNGSAAPATGALPTKPASTRLRRLAVAAALAVTAVVAFADHGLQPYAAFDDGAGSPTVLPFSAAAAVPAGWQIRPIVAYKWAAQYFGIRATWDSYRITAPDGHTVISADVVRTDDKGRLDLCNPQNCFLFGSDDIRTSQRIDLGHGVYGVLLNYANPVTKNRWGTVSWMWPVDENGEVFYERIVLTSSPLITASTAPNLQPASGLQDIFLVLLNGVSGSSENPALMPAYHEMDTVLMSEAQVLVTRALEQRL
jgi:exosortase/archaeosortase family protein